MGIQYIASFCQKNGTEPERTHNKFYYSVTLANPSRNPRGPSRCGIYGGLTYTTAYYL